MPIARLGWFFCHHGAGRVNEPRQEGVFVIIKACQPLLG
jgi:hypothetical protein